MPSAEPTPILGTALPPERMEPVPGRRGLVLGVGLVVALAIATGIGAALFFLRPTPSDPVALPTTLPTVVPTGTPPTGTIPSVTTPTGTTPSVTTPTGTTPTLSLIHI